ncbi:hypothetical protein [Falsiroseomonas sp. CW058]|uniref:hypothetical protein n=1 Tax=Falsiroseomonas sp. CW058 TaxID=3388664 RepID=UPI003D322628
MRHLALALLLPAPVLAQPPPQARPAPPVPRLVILDRQCRGGDRQACRDAAGLRAGLTGDPRGGAASGQGAGPPGRGESFRLEELTAPPSANRPGHNLGE